MPSSGRLRSDPRTRQGAGRRYVTRSSKKFDFDASARDDAGSTGDEHGNTSSIQLRNNSFRSTKSNSTHVESTGIDGASASGDNTDVSHNEGHASGNASADEHNGEDKEEDGDDFDAREASEILGGAHSPTDQLSGSEEEEDEDEEDQSEDEEDESEGEDDESEEEDDDSDDEDYDQLKEEGDGSTHSSGSESDVDHGRTRHSRETPKGYSLPPPSSVRPTAPSPAVDLSGIISFLTYVLGSQHQLAAEEYASLKRFWLALVQRKDASSTSNTSPMQQTPSGSLDRHGTRDTGTQAALIPPTLEDHTTSADEAIPSDAHLVSLLQRLLQDQPPPPASPPAGVSTPSNSLNAVSPKSTNSPLRDLPDMPSVQPSAFARSATARSGAGRSRPGTPPYHSMPLAPSAPPSVGTTSDSLRLPDRSVISIPIQGGPGTSHRPPGVIQPLADGPQGSTPFALMDLGESDDEQDPDFDPLMIDPHFDLSVPPTQPFWNPADIQQDIDTIMQGKEIGASSIPPNSWPFQMPPGLVPSSSQIMAEVSGSAVNNTPTTLPRQPLAPNERTPTPSNQLQAETTTNQVPSEGEDGLTHTSEEESSESDEDDIIGPEDATPPVPAKDAPKKRGRPRKYNSEEQYREARRLSARKRRAQKSQLGRDVQNLKEELAEAQEEMEDQRVKIQCEEDPTSSREVLIPSNKDLIPCKGNLTPSSEDLIPSHEDLIPSNADLIPNNKSLIPRVKDLVPSNKGLVPGNKGLLPNNKGLVPSNKDLMPRNESLDLNNEDVLV